VAGYLGVDRCGDLVCRALADSSETVRRAAVEQLPFTSEGGAELLLEALRTESPRTKAAAAHALRLVESADVEAGLIAALDDPDPWVRYFSADSLAAHGRADATGALAAAAEHDDATHVRIAALRSLSAIDAATSVNVARTLMASADDDLACAAIAVLAAAAETDVDDLLQQAVYHVKPARRLAAVEALGGRSTDRAVAILAEAAHLPVEPSLAPTAIVALGRLSALESAAGYDALEALLVLGSDPEWRSQVLRAIAALPLHSVTSIQAQMSALPPVARRVAIEGLARMRHSEASSAILSALDDIDAGVRGAAVTAVGRLAPLMAADIIATLASSDPDSGVRRRALMVCRRHGWHDNSGPSVP
jgi:HEAT repeat protein